MTFHLDITHPPTCEGERLLYACADPFGSGAYVFRFGDHGALLVAAGGTRSRWLEEAWKMAALSGGPRYAWTWVPGPVRAEVWRRALEPDDPAVSSLDR